MAMGTGSVAEINVTPLIDVLLVLLIIFMVIVPVTPRGLNAAVPQPPKSKSDIDPAATIVVQVASGQDGSPTYKINEEAFTKAALAPELTRIFASRQQKVMFVQGDARLEYARVAEVIDFGHQAGVEDVGIITPGVVR